MRKPILGIAALALLSACGGGGGDDGVIVVPGPTPTPAPTPAPTPGPTPAPTGYVATEVGRGDYSSFAFLPDGRAIYTSRDGTISIAPAASPASPVALTGRIPSYRFTDGGLLSIVVDPDFATNGYVFFSATDGSPTTSAAMTIIRARMVGAGTTASLVDVQPIWRGTPVPISNRLGRFGGQMAFNKGYLHVAIGDFGIPNAAQDLSGTLGKVIRIARDGSAAPDNPQFGVVGRAIDVITAGHRDPTGLTVGSDGRIYETESAPAIGDELNVIEVGRNYGWPLASEGNQEDGSPYPRHSAIQGATAPYYVWRTVTGPSGIVQVRGNRDGLAGQLLIGATGGQEVLRGTPGTNALELGQAVRVGSPVRVVAEAPDGTVYGITYDTDGRIFRIDRR